MWDHHIVRAIRSGHSGMGQCFLNNRLYAHQRTKLTVDQWMGVRNLVVMAVSCCDVGVSCCIGKVIVDGKGGCDGDEDDDGGICGGK